MNATISLRLDETAINRLCRLGYLHPQDRDPVVIRNAAAAALAAALSPQPVHDDERY